MGLLSLALLAAMAFVALALLGVGRTMWSLAGAALALGAIGYAWQGQPMLPAAPAATKQAIAPIDMEGLALRESLLGRYTADNAYITAADAMMRAGDPAAASRVVLSGIGRMPDSFILWTWAGVTLSAAAGGQLSPPALLAFRKAGQLAPNHPAPPFYLGLSYVRAGDFATARPLWARAVAMSTPGTQYRQEIAMRLALLDRLLAMSRDRR